MTEAEAARKKEEFIQVVARMIMDTPNGTVMLLVDNGNGLQTVSNTMSFLTIFGLLTTAEKYFDQKYRASIEATSETDEKRMVEYVKTLTRKETQN